MPTPDYDHPITIQPAARRWRARFGDHVIADSDNALVLEEADRPAVIYFPRADVSTEYMSTSDRRTHCPYKGDTSYLTLVMDGQVIENIAWCYEHPFPAMEAIGGRVAFCADKVELYEVDDAAVNPHHLDGAAADARAIDEVILHTDAGGGTTQRPHWAPNTTGPDDEAEAR